MSQKLQAKTYEVIAKGGNPKRKFFSFFSLPSSSSLPFPPPSRKDVRRALGQVLQKQMLRWGFKSK